MKNALGLIESKGLIALIEAADVILKNSPVEILWVRKLNNGLITLAISGESDYVIAAMNMAVEAANKVGEIYSHSVIENPDEKLLKIFEESSDDHQLFFPNIKSDKEEKLSSSKPLEKMLAPKKVGNKDREKIKPVKKLLDKSRPKLEKPEKSNLEKTSNKIITENLESDKTTDIHSSATMSTLERLRREALGISDNGKKTSRNVEEKKELPVQKNEYLNKEIDLNAIQNMNVHELRRYAREFDNFPIKGRQISRANRNEIVELFKKITS